MVNFLKDKEEDYIKLFNQTYFNKIIYYMMLSVNLGVPELHKSLKSKMEAFQTQYPYVKGGLKKQIKNNVKANYFLSRLFLQMASCLSHIR